MKAPLWVLTLCAAAAAAPASALCAPTPEPASSTLAAINAARRAVEVTALAPDTALDAIARAYARDMAARHYFGHLSPDKKSIVDRLDAANYGYGSAGENLAAGATESEAMQALLHDPPHRENILSPQFTRVGIAVLPRGDGTVVLVEEFSGP